MRARTSATVRADGGVTGLYCEPPLTLRRVRSDDPAQCALCLIGTAAGPLPGDDLGLDLHLEPGARAVLTATGASIAQGTGKPASLRLSATLADGADLVADPGPLILCAGSRVHVGVHLELAATASVQWREVVILGRTFDDEPGAATITWDVTRDRRPVLRQRLDLTDPLLRRWATAGHRVLASAVLCGPDITARTVVHDATAVAQRVDAGTVLVTVLDDSAAAAARRLNALLAPLLPAPLPSPLAAPLLPAPAAHR